MPPTFAAASTTEPGRSVAKNSRTAAASSRSSSARVRVRISHGSPASSRRRSSARTIALPTRPRWPATKIRLGSGFIADGSGFSYFRMSLPLIWFLSMAMSASVMMRTSSVKVTFGVQPSCFFAFEASPMSSSTSAGR